MGGLLPLIFRTMVGTTPLSAPRQDFPFEDLQNQMIKCGALVRNSAPDPWIFPLSSLTMN